MRISFFPFKCLHLSSRKFSSSCNEVYIYLSACHDIYKNLAFEDWIYEKVDLSNKRILFLWRNNPTVVIGRHQNPWQECSLKTLQEKYIKLARRKSGGGTVYHDLGNLNLSFFTHRSLYNRPENLALVVKALKDRWKLDVKATPRDDILLEDKYKISGTSSKLGRVTAYHHCTLLLDVDMHLLHDVLRPTYENIVSNATASVGAVVKNLCKVNSALNFDNVAMAIAEEYSAAYSNDEKLHLQVVDPSNEEMFPGISEFHKELQSWQWLYGKTPKSTIPFKTKLSHGDTTLTFHCYRGIIQETDIVTDSSYLDNISSTINLALKGVRFWQEDIHNALVDAQNTMSVSTKEHQYLIEVIRWMNKML